ncbi:MAG TPA: STAS domain-containing protein [Nitrospirota bacterium]
MSATLTRTGGNAFVTLDGDLTLPHAEEIKSVFIKALLDADSLLLRFGGVRDVDLSCLQLICSAHRSGVRFKKRMDFSGEAPEEMLNAAEEAGYSLLKGCLKGCRQDCEKICLWMKAFGENNER